MGDFTALTQYVVAAAVVGLSATALMSAVVLRTIAGELAGRGLGHHVLPALRTLWLTLGAVFILAGALWMLGAAGVIAPAVLQRFGLPLLLIAVGVLMVTLFRRGVEILR